MIHSPLDCHKTASGREGDSATDCASNNKLVRYEQVKHHLLLYVTRKMNLLHSYLLINAARLARMLAACYAKYRPAMEIAYGEITHHPLLVGWANFIMGRRQ